MYVSRLMTGAISTVGWTLAATTLMRHRINWSTAWLAWKLYFVLTQSTKQVRVKTILQSSSGALGRGRMSSSLMAGRKSYACTWWISASSWESILEMARDISRSRRPFMNDVIGFTIWQWSIAIPGTGGRKHVWLFSEQCTCLCPRTIGRYLLGHLHISCWPCTRTEPTLKGLNTMCTSHQTTGNKLAA